MAESKEAKVKSHYVRLLEARTEMPQPVKDTEGFKYKYAALPQVNEIVSKSLAKHGMFVQQGSELIDGKTYLVSKLIDTIDDSVNVLDIRPIVQSDNPQDVGAAETYARRYSLSTNFGLVSEDDNDCAPARKAEFKGVGQCKVCGTRYKFANEEQMNSFKCQCGAVGEFQCNS